MPRSTRILRRLNICVVLISLGVNSVAVAQQGSIEEAAALNQQVEDLYQEGRYEEAISRAERVLAIYEKVLGPEHPDTAMSLSNLAGLYYDMGAYGKAEPLFRRALTITEKVLGSEHPGTATALNNLGVLYGDMGVYAKAEPLHQRALAIREKVLGPEHPDTAVSLNNLALLYHATGAYAKAESFYQRALAIREKALGPEHPATATSVNNLAGLYGDMGAYGKAEPFYQRALAIREKVLGPEHPDTAMSLSNLAGLYYDMGAYGKAEPLFRRALTITEKVLGPEHPGTATALKNLGGLYHATGAYGKVESFYQRALAIREKVLGPEHPNTAVSLNDLAALYDSMGAYGKAEPFYQRALTIREKVLGPEHPDTAVSLNDLAGLYHTTGAYGKAEPFYQRALAIREKVLGSEHPATATSLNNLAELYRDTGAYGKAEPFYQRALAIGEKVLGADHLRTAKVLHNLAGLYRDTGGYAKAEPLYQRALAIHEKALGPEHPNTAVSLNNLALLYKAMGAYGKAESFYQRALAIREKALGPEHPGTGVSLSNLAMLRWTMGDVAAALPLFERGQAIEWKNADRFLLTGSESRKQAYLEELRRGQSGLISLSLVLSGRRATTLGFTSVLQTKGRVLDAMSDSIGRLRLSVKPSDRALIDELTALAQQQSVLTHQGPGNFQPEAYRQRLEELSLKQEHLETELSKRSAEFRQQVAPVTLAAVQVAIPKGAALIEWYRYDPFSPKAEDQQSRSGKPRYVAYVLRHEGEPVVVDVGEADRIEQLVHDFRQGLSDPTHTYVKDVAKELYERLLKPLEQHPGKVEHLLISPDGALNLVPFAALRDEKGNYVGAKVAIAYLTSGRDLLRFGTRPAAKSDMVLAADPDYGSSAKQMAQVDRAVQPTRSLDLDRGGMVFSPLPGTAVEAKALKGLLKVSDDYVLTQAQAAEDRLKQLHGPRILHIATHGFFLRDNELPATTLRFGTVSDEKVVGPIGENPLLRSGLALAGANQRRSGEKDDGILTAAEVAQMDLRGTQLVVLSACETGVGDVQNGEGVYGLRRALVLAGAESQVSSLWKVADEATKDLMVDYYQRLLKGEGRSQALRNAQRTMMKSKDRSHPYYWAAFVPIGDWRPLAKSR